MKKITVTEFEFINEDKLRENNPNYNGEFKELINFIEEFASSPDNEDAYKFISIKKNRQYGEHVIIKNYVGVIQLKSGFQIEILPKIDMAPNDEEKKKIFLKMIRSMKDFDGKNFHFANLKIEKMNLYEVFINLYLQETYRLIKRGLKSSYISCEENLNVLKGKLIFKEQIRKNIVNNHKFYVQYDDYQLNRPENKIIKSTLLSLLNISEDVNNIKLCRQLLGYFELIDPSINHESDFSKIIINRNMKDYKTIIKWSKVFLKNKSFSTFSGDSQSKALLFQMDKLFESYIGKFLKRVVEDKDTIVSIQDKGYYLFDSPNPEFALRPDIIIRKGNMIKIIDTKWKSLFKDSNKNYGISQQDMYQMYAYSKKYGQAKSNPEVWIFYPLNNEMKGYPLIDFSDNEGVTVHIRFIDLSNDIEDELLKIVN